MKTKPNAPLNDAQLEELMNHILGGNNSDLEDENFSDEEDEISLISRAHIMEETLQTKTNDEINPEAEHVNDSNIVVEENYEENYEENLPSTSKDSAKKPYQKEGMDFQEN